MTGTSQLALALLPFLLLSCNEALKLVLGKIKSLNIDRLQVKGCNAVFSVSFLLCCVPVEPVNSKALLYDATGKPSIVQQSIIDDQTYRKPLFNLPPSETFFPSYYKGLWNCEYKYSSAEFSDRVQFKDLQRDPNVAGFRKYSVASMPDIGKDVVTTRKLFMQPFSLSLAPRWIPILPCQIISHLFFIIFMFSCRKIY